MADRTKGLIKPPSDFNKIGQTVANISCIMVFKMVYHSCDKHVVCLSVTMVDCDHTLQQKVEIGT